MTKLLIITMIATVTLMSCKNETKKAEVTETTVVFNKTETAQDYQLGAQVPNELVCMVNNVYMGTPQIPVPVNGKIYYGCCQMCVGTLNKDQTARTGKDPYSNKPIDKTEAYIVLMDNDGRVDYFESKKNYLTFKK